MAMEETRTSGHLLQSQPYSARRHSYCSKGQEWPKELFHLPSRAAQQRQEEEPLQELLQPIAAAAALSVWKPRKQVLCFAVTVGAKSLLPLLPSRVQTPNFIISFSQSATLVSPIFWT
jgi:hypothetical protein